MVRYLAFGCSTVNTEHTDGVWLQTAGPGEEDPDRGQWDSCSRVWAEETSGFIPGKTRGTAKVYCGFRAAHDMWGKERIKIIQWHDYANCQKRAFSHLRGVWFIWNLKLYSSVIYSNNCSNDNDKCLNIFVYGPKFNKSIATHGEHRAKNTKLPTCWSVQLLKVLSQELVEIQTPLKVEWMLDLDPLNGYKNGLWFIDKSTRDPMSPQLSVTVVMWVLQEFWCSHSPARHPWCEEGEVGSSWSSS